MSLYYISVGGYESKNVNIRSVKGCLFQFPIFILGEWND